MNAMTLVQLHHNEPVTNSIAISDGVGLQHKNVLELIRRHAESLAEFGGVAFETRPFETDGGKQWRDVAFLNEPQSTLLITFMRNSEIVVKFKVALVKAFYELRASGIQLENRVSNPAYVVAEHEANSLVTADRTFRSLIRSGVAAGMGQYAARNMANDATARLTGIDLMKLMQVDRAKKKSHQDYVVEFETAWKSGALDVKYKAMSPETLYYDVYLKWCRRNKALELSLHGFYDYIRVTLNSAPGWKKRK